VRVRRFKVKVNDEVFEVEVEEVGSGGVSTTPRVIYVDSAEGSDQDKTGFEFTSKDEGAKTG
jgi:hypothetical protein